VKISESEQGKSSGMITSGHACLGMALPAFVERELYRSDWVVISTFVGTGYTTRR